MKEIDNVISLTKLLFCRVSYVHIIMLLRERHQVMYDDTKPTIDQTNFPYPRFKNDPILASCASFLKLTRPRYLQTI